MTRPAVLPDAAKPTHGNAGVTIALLTPALLVVLGLFGGGLVLAVLQSLGAAALVGAPELSLEHYAAVLTDPEFVPSLLTSLGTAATSTVLALVLGTAAALVLRRSRTVRSGLTLLQVSLPVPHLLGAIAFSLLLADSGLLSRFVAAGLGSTMDSFPALVNDPASIGVIVSYVWKEAPFVAVVVLAALGPQVADYERLAATLAAGRLARLRYVTLPLLTPALLAAGMLVFAFTLGAYEVPALLGRSYPEALPVFAYREFSSTELDARPAGLALAVLISLIGMFAAIGYALAARRLRRRGPW